MELNDWLAITGALRDWKLSAGIHILCKPQNARKENASADSVENENERKQVDWLEKRYSPVYCQECRKDSTRKSVNIVYGSIISLNELIATNGNYVINFRIYGTRKPSDSPTRKVLLLADGHVEGDFSKNRKKETATKDCTEVKADKETTSDIHEEKRSES